MGDRKMEQWNVAASIVDVHESTWDFGAIWGYRLLKLCKIVACQFYEILLSPTMAEGTISCIDRQYRALAKPRLERFATRILPYFHESSG